MFTYELKTSTRHINPLIDKTLIESHKFTEIYFWISNGLVSKLTGLPGSILYKVGTLDPIVSYGGWWSSSQGSNSNTAWARWLSYRGENVSTSFDSIY